MKKSIRDRTIRFFCLKEHQVEFKAWLKSIDSDDLEAHFIFLIEEVKRAEVLTEYVDLSHFSAYYINNKENYIYFSVDKVVKKAMKTLTKLQKLYLSQLLVYRVTNA